MEKSKKVFVFNTAWYKIIRNCSTLVKGEVFTAVMEYAESGKIIELSNEANVIFQFIKREIDKREVRRQKASKTADKPAPVRQTNQPETTTETVILKMLYGIIFQFFHNICNRIIFIRNKFSPV